MYTLIFCFGVSIGKVSMLFFAKKVCCFLTLDDQFPSQAAWGTLHWQEAKVQNCLPHHFWFPRKIPQGPRWVFQPISKRTSSKQPASFRTWMVLRPHLTCHPTFSPSFFLIDLSKSGKLTSWGWGCGNIPLFTKGFLAPSKRWFSRRSSEPSTVTKGTSGFWDSKNKRYQVHVGPSDLGGEESWFLENHSNWQQHQSR